MAKQSKVRDFPMNDTITTTKVEQESKPKYMFMVRVCGLFLLAMSVSVFVQGVPLLFVFIGAYLGVPADSTISDMDSMVWLLTSITMMIFVLYVFRMWMSYVWSRFITKPKPILLFNIFKRKEKHTAP